MKASELISKLKEMVLEDGDLEVVVCGFDGAGYDDMTVVNTIHAVPVQSYVCTYADVDRAARIYGMGDDATQHHRHFIYICG